mmetsp:Transcript_16338/g.49754  ORF Transcript_16338/g.49754 Transcript_16338/m.49754 type:complete len:84 (-) Transcript_16338:2184-2435(-)|eukprot:scaffold40278_cov35-Tisochrysis_lutea.AAC.3
MYVPLGGLGAMRPHARNVYLRQRTRMLGHEPTRNIRRSALAHHRAATVESGAKSPRGQMLLVRQKSTTLVWAFATFVGEWETL